MAHYTTQIRSIVEMATQTLPDNTPISSRIESAAPSIFNFSFPIWDENYRLILESKILRHFYMWEIGLETVGLWKLYLEMKLNEIMPYYNDLYKSIGIDYNILGDTDITETLQRDETKTETANYKSNEENDTDTTEDYSGTTDATGKSTQVTSGNPSSHTAHSDFPQAPLGQSDYATYEDYRQDVLNQTVVTNNEDNTASDGKTIRTTNQDVDFSSSNNVNANTDTSHTIHRAGTSGNKSFTELLNQYRDSLLNIDMMIIGELECLFMSVY